MAIVQVLGGNIIGQVRNIDDFLLLSARMDIEGYKSIKKGLWPDKQQEWQWVSYRQNSAGTVAIVADCSEFAEDSDIPVAILPDATPEEGTVPTEPED